MYVKLVPSLPQVGACDALQQVYLGLLAMANKYEAGDPANGIPPNSVAADLLRNQALKLSTDSKMNYGCDWAKVTLLPEGQGESGWGGPIIRDVGWPDPGPPWLGRPVADPWQGKPVLDP